LTHVRVHAMTLDLSSSCGKLVRALFHLNALGDEFESMGRVASAQLTVPQEEIYPDPRGSRHVFPIGQLVYPSIMVGPIVGDYIQNLRSALDHLAWGMVQNGSPRGYNPKVVQFPIYSIGRTTKTGQSKPRTFNSEYKRHLPGVSRYMRALARRHQPYRRGNWHLGVLANFSNRDKHQVITPVHLFVSKDIRRHHLRPTFGRILEWRILLPEGEPVSETTPFLEVILDEPEAKVEMYATVTTKVAFEERDGHYRRLPELVEIGEKVAEIVGEAASRWGNATDAAVCKRWATTARRVLGQGISPTPPGGGFV
jgi:hypothetical protein